LNDRKYFADISYNPQSDTVQIVAEFGPLSSAGDFLKLILSIANFARDTAIQTSDQSQALSWIRRECQMALTMDYSKSSQKDS